MSRSHWKGCYVAKNLFKYRGKLTEPKYIGLRDKNSAIPAFVIKDRNIAVGITMHNGEEYKGTSHLGINTIGYKFGEFVFTRRFVVTDKTLKKRNMLKKIGIKDKKKGLVKKPSTKKK